MDVRIVSNMPLPLPRSLDIKDNGAAPATSTSTNQEIPFVFAKEKSVNEQVREQVMMNLQEVQNFLYMLIGSRLRLESHNESIGNSVNTAA